MRVSSKRGEFVEAATHHVADATMLDAIDVRAANVGGRFVKGGRAGNEAGDTRLHEALFARRVGRLADDEQRNIGALGAGTQKLGQRDQFGNAVAQADADGVGFCGQHRIDDAVDSDRLRYQPRLAQRVHQVGARSLVGVGHKNLAASTRCLSSSPLCRVVSASTMTGSNRVPLCWCSESRASCLGRRRLK